jgi:hypothetical protein
VGIDTVLNTGVRAPHNAIAGDLSTPTSMWYYECIP